MPRMGIPSSRPQAPQSHPQKSKAINIATAFMFVTFPVIQVTTNVPTKVAMASELTDTNRAIQKEPNCMKAAMPVATAVNAGPR